MSAYFRQDYLPVPDGAEIYFQVHGEGDPGMVLCDGLGCDGFAWKYLLPELKKDFRVLRWHYRGHGKSTVPTDRDRLGMLYTCDDLDRVMGAAGMENAVIFGHSMGVQVALEFHRRFSHRVRGLVLICGSYGNPLDTFHETTIVRTALPYLKKMVEKFPTTSRQLTRLALSTDLAIDLSLRFEANQKLMKKSDFAPYFEHLANMDPVMFVRTLTSLSEHSAWDHLPQIDVPTLVIGGERDSFTPVWLSRRMADHIPGAEFMLLSEGTHTAPLEQPELVYERVQRFLRDHVLDKALPAASSVA